MRILISLLLCILLIAGCGTTNGSNAKNESDHVKTDLRSPEKKFIEDKMDSLIKSTSSLIDLTWKTTVTESIDNFQSGVLKAESTISDLELSKQQYDNKIKEIESFDFPEELNFSESAIIYINSTMENLVIAIQKRTEIIDFLIDAVNKGVINNETIQEVEMKLIVANASLDLSAKSYGMVFENLD